MLKERILLPIILWVTVLVLSSSYLADSKDPIRFEDKKQDITRIIHQIEKQTHFTVGYTHNQLDTTFLFDLPSLQIELPELLEYIIQETGGSYKIVENHILLLSREKEINSLTGKKESSPGDLLDTPIQIRGTVIDSITRQPLVYATICILDPTGDIIKAGVTDDNGLFSIEVNHRPELIRISFIGYTTRQERIEAAHPTIWELAPDGKVLDDVVVTASGVSYQVDRNSYLVTAKMREGTTTAAELLNHIHGVRFNPLTNEISVGMESAILLLVDGLQQSQEYIRNLPPDRIEQIEVVREPTGRYLSEGYNAIINFKLKKDFTGYDLGVRNFLILNTAGHNGDDMVMMEQPGLNFTYSRNKWNIYGSAAMGRSRWNSTIQKEVSYPGLYNVSTIPTSLEQPNDRYKYLGGIIAMGANYQLKPDHTLSLQFEYEGNDDSTDNNLLQEQTFFTGEEKRNIHTVTSNSVKASNYITSLYYKGKISEATELYSDLSYNYYGNTIRNLFQQQAATKYEIQNNYKEKKDQLVFNLDLTHTFSPLFSLNGGYTGNWRKYTSQNRAGETFLDYQEIRNKLFSYVSFNLSETFKLKIGTGLEHLYTDNSRTKQNRWNWQPYLQMNYKPAGFLNINAGYLTNIYYPSLYQLSSLHTSIDSLLTQVGNPDLKSAIRHTISARFTFWDRFTISPVFKYTPHRISDYYKVEDNNYYRTFENIAMNQYILQLALDQPLGKKVTFSSNLYFYHDYPRLGKEKNKENGFLMNAELEYFHPEWKLGINLIYSRMLERSLMLQGYQMINMDAWMLGVVKQFPRRNLSLTLNWFPPVDWGLRQRQEKLVDTSFYKESTSTNMNIYQGILMLRLNIRFNGGQVKSTRKQSAIEREQREQRSIGF